MTIKRTSIASVHPGEFILYLLNEHALKQVDVAKRLKVSRAYLNDICRGRRGISPEMACKLACIFGIDEELILNMQMKWELAQIDRTSIKKEFKRIAA